MGLEGIRVASPCSADWNLMKGDDQVRFCSQCEKHVYNFSAMPQREIEALLSGHEKVCGRFYRRADGTMLTSDCPVGLKAKIARVGRRASIAFSTLAGFAALAQAQTPIPVPQSSDIRATLTADLTGTATDSAGAGIPKAK